MKKIANIFILFALVGLVAGGAMAKKGRKLPVGAYIKSAKIHIISGDLKRYEEGVAMLDSLFMNYGPHAEGLHLMGQIMVDYVDQTPNPTERIEYIKKLVAYNDSLHLCCENKDIKRKYRDNCDEYIVKADSIKVKYWREFYNYAVAQLKKISEYQDDISAETDSVAIATINQYIQDNVDSTTANFEMCMLLEPADERSYVGMGSMYEKMGDYEQSIEWLKKGLEKTDNKAQLLMSIAYNNYNAGNACEAAEYLKQYIEGFAPEDLENMGNLIVFYNICKKPLESFEISTKMLALAPENYDALIAAGNYYNNYLRQNANDSMAVYQGNDEAKTKEWQLKRDEHIDSALVYYGRAADVNPDDETVWMLYATYSAIRQKWEDASKGFTKLTELAPSESDNWVYLGDCHIRLEKFDDALIAYEKASELNPNDKDTWLQLVALYSQLGKNAKKAEAQKKADAL